MGTKPDGSRANSDRPRVDPSRVRLVRGKGSKGRGGDPGGYYWHIRVDERRVGHVYINLYGNPCTEVYPYLNIQLNAAWQNQGIGRVAYRLAVEESGYVKVYAHMRKSNKASRKAAHYAGFEVVENPGDRQLLMMWTRSRWT